MIQQLNSAASLDFTPVGNVFPSPAEWRDQVIYQVLIDRFDNGQEGLTLLDPDQVRRRCERDVRDGHGFCGGTIRGITRRLDYIKSLGCTTLWLSPPFKNRQEDPGTWHGYGVQDFLAVDPRFGTMEDLRELVQAAHARGMYVILDVIINHTGDNWGYPDDQKLSYHETGRYDFGFWRRRNGGHGALTADDAVWPVELQDPDCYKRRGRIRNMGAASMDEAVNGDFEGLKDLELARPQVLDTLIRCYKWWIAQIDCDGFRIDTVKHVEPEPAAIFCNAIREYAISIGKHQFFLVGEVVADDELLKKYVARNTPNEDEPHLRYPRLDACLDFPLFFVLEEVIKGLKPPGELIERYERFRHFYRDYGRVGKYFVTFLDNHDQMHRPYRRFMHGENDFRLAVLGVGYLLTSLGIPCIYYGTEQCLDGGGSSDACVRETMFGSCWGAFGQSGPVHVFNEQHPAYRGMAKIAQIRAREPVLRYGRQYFRDISGNGVDFGPPLAAKCTLAWARVLDTTSILIAMNLEPRPRNDWVAVDAKLNPPGRKMIDLLSGREVMVQTSPNGTACVHLPLESREMVILKGA